MKRTTVLLCLLAAVLAAGCGSSTDSGGRSLAATSPTSSPSPTKPAVPYFDSPEAAMRYLASAWNRQDLVALKHVTNPIARELLEVMRHEAVDLRLDHCTANDDRKDYDCTFTHGFPAGYTGHDHRAGYAESDKPGTAVFVVGPADRSGWYMTVLVSCG